jgi:hypothetical protein
MVPQGFYGGSVEPNDIVALHRADLREYVRMEDEVQVASIFKRRRSFSYEVFMLLSW